MPAFLKLLHDNDIDVLADVRSSPYSRYVPHFNRASLEAEVRAAGLRYVYLGRELGGRPEGAEFYDAEGHALYYKVAKTELFRGGIARLHEGMRQYRVALMCSEENPSECHRRKLVGCVLAKEGVDVRHIRGDGSVQPEAALRETERPLAVQQSLFGDSVEDVEGDETTWKSIRSVLPANRPASSSKS